MRKLFAELIVFFLALLFTYASFSKLMDYDRFVFQMHLSPFGPIKNNAGLLAVFVPISECAIVLLLLAPKTRLIGVYASLLVLSLFELYILWMLFSGLQLPCTCGGIISKMSWKGHLLFNAFFISIALFYALLRRKNILTRQEIPTTFSRV